MPWKSVSSGLQLHEDNKHWFEWLVCQLGQDDQENWKFKRKEKEEEKMIHKNFSKFYSFDIYVTFS